MAAVETLIARDDGAVAQREAARIWARAVTVRDRLAVPADTDGEAARDRAQRRAPRCVAPPRAAR